MLLRGPVMAAGPDTHVKVPTCRANTRDHVLDSVLSAGRARPRRSGQQLVRSGECTQDRAIEGNTNCQCKQRALFSRPLIARRSRPRQRRSCVPALSRSGPTPVSSRRHSQPLTSRRRWPGRRGPWRYPAAPQPWRSSCAASAWPAGTSSCPPIPSSPPRRRRCGPAAGRSSPTSTRHLRAEPADGGRGADAADGRRNAGAHRRPDLPAGRRVAAAVRRARDRAGRGCRARARLGLRGRAGWFLRRGRGLLVLPDQGRDVWRGRHDPHRRPTESSARRGSTGTRARAAPAPITTSGTGTPGG